MSDRPNRNEQRRARALAAQEGLSYQQALARVRDGTTDLQPPVSMCRPAALQPGEVRTVVIAWRLDDPVVQDDGRFWMRVAEQAVGVLGKPAGTIVPNGQTLGSWLARARGEEVELTNPVTRERERLSFARWSDADRERTHVIVAFEHRPEAARRRGAVRAPVKLELSDEASRLRAERERLQSEFRAARDRGDERRMRELSGVLQAKADDLARVAFPDYARGWDLSRAIREGTNRYVLDWTTGY